MKLLGMTANKDSNLSPRHSDKPRSCVYTCTARVSPSGEYVTKFYCFYRATACLVRYTCYRPSVWPSICHTGGSVKTVEVRIMQSRPYTPCSEKNTRSHFLSYLHVWCV